MTTFFMALLLLVGGPLWAHQPVMDMAPRWKDGFGFQFRQESFLFKDVMSGRNSIENPFGLEKRVDKIWLEGIYTFRREVRLSFKLPQIHQSRGVLIDGMPIHQSAEGFGDLIIGLPLKRYTNRATRTGNIAFTPSIRLPSGSTDGDFPLGDGSLDFGFSFSKSIETKGVYQYYDLFYWKNGEGEQGMEPGDEVGLDVNIGVHPYHNNLKNQGLFLMLDLSGRYEREGRNLVGFTGGRQLNIGPVLVLYRGGVMFRAEYSLPVFESVEGTQLAKTRKFNIGIGFVF